MDNFDQELIEEGLVLLRQRLGEEIYGGITIVSQEQILFLMDIVHALEQVYDNKRLRRWLSKPNDDLGGIVPATMFIEDWDQHAIGPLKVKRVAESLKDKEECS